MRVDLTQNDISMIVYALSKMYGINDFSEPFPSTLPIQPRELFKRLRNTQRHCIKEDDNDIFNQKVLERFDEFCKGMEKAYSSQSDYDIAVLNGMYITKIHFDEMVNRVPQFEGYTLW